MSKLEDFGFIQSRPRGEYHANNQQMSKLLHKAVGLGNKGAAPQEAYAAYQQHFKDSPVRGGRRSLPPGCWAAAAADAASVDVSHALQRGCRFLCCLLGKKQ
jgi:hypothetical protein